jgi:hypothetical protein
VNGLPRTLAPLLTLPLTLALAGGACGGPPPAPNRLWTMADLQYESHQSNCSNPAQLGCQYFVTPRLETDQDVLVFKLAFAEGEPMGYITTDFWANYDRIWVQPMYFLVTRWNADAPRANRLLEEDGVTLAGPIFSVGPDSAFYSPFWSVFYVEVPPGTASGKYTSARQLFDDGLVMHQGANRFASIAPATVDLPNAQDITQLYQGLFKVDVNDYLAPIANPPSPDDTPLARVVASAQRLPSGWIDGVSVPYFDFGTDNFAANSALEVQDVPLYVFTQRLPTGVDDFLGAPNVGGVAAPFSGVAARVSPDHRPQFGGLWRLYLVNVPEGAAMLDKATATSPTTGEVPDMLKARVLRVALNADDCFGPLKASEGAMDTCVWLDSQKALEYNLPPSAFTRTGLQPACPFVMWKRYPVPNP